MLFWNNPYEYEYKCVRRISNVNILLKWVFNVKITNFGLSGLSFYTHDKFSCGYKGWHIKVNHTNFGLKFIFSKWTLGIV